MNAEDPAGYIVTGWNMRGAMELAPDKTLWHADAGTLFPDYESARRALRKTRRENVRGGFGWDMHKCRIQRVRLLRKEGKADAR